MRASFAGPVVRVLAADPDLAAAIDPRELQAARQRSLASCVTFERGPWAPPVEIRSDGPTLLLIDGLLAHRVAVNDRQTVELLGPGDVLSPGEWAEGFRTIPMQSEWRAHEAGALAVLDRRWHERLVRWPEIQLALLDRTIERSRSAVMRLALARTPNLPERLRLLLWHLARRWGRVEPSGVVLPLRLSQETLAEFACAQRESVSRALGELMHHDLLAPRPGGKGWILRGNTPTEIEELAAETAAPEGAHHAVTGA